MAELSQHGTLGPFLVELDRDRDLDAETKASLAELASDTGFLHAVGGFAKATVGAWTHAGRRAAKLRLEAARLARRRSHVQYDLGGAVHAGDAPRVERLRDEMRELDFAIEERARTAKAALERAH